jgi:hypothetical protein
VLLWPRPCGAAPTGTRRRISVQSVYLCVLEQRRSLLSYPSTAHARALPPPASEGTSRTPVLCVAGRTAGVGELLAGLSAYSGRHMSRLDRLVGTASHPVRKKERSALLFKLPGRLAPCSLCQACAFPQLAGPIATGRHKPFGSGAPTWLRSFLFTGHAFVPALRCAPRTCWTSRWSPWACWEWAPPPRPPQPPPPPPTAQPPTATWLTARARTA